MRFSFSRRRLGDATFVIPAEAGIHNKPTPRSGLINFALCSLILNLWFSFPKRYTLNAVRYKTVIPTSPHTVILSGAKRSRRIWPTHVINPTSVIPAKAGIHNIYPHVSRAIFVVAVADSATLFLLRKLPLAPLEAFSLLSNGGRSELQKMKILRPQFIGAFSLLFLNFNLWFCFLIFNIWFSKVSSRFRRVKFPEPHLKTKCHCERSAAISINNPSSIIHNHLNCHPEWSPAPIRRKPNLNWCGTQSEGVLGFHNPLLNRSLISFWLFGNRFDKLTTGWVWLGLFYPRLRSGTFS